MGTGPTPPLGSSPNKLGGSKQDVPGGAAKVAQAPPVQPPVIPVLSPEMLKETFQKELGEFENKWKCPILCRMTTNPVTLHDEGNADHGPQIFDNDAIGTWLDECIANPVTRGRVVDRRSEKSEFDKSFITFLESQKKHLNNPDVQKIMIEDEEFVPLLDRVVDISLQEEKTTLYTLLSQIPDTAEERVFHTTKVTALIKDNPLLIYAKNKNGETPLHLSAQKGHADVAQYLIGAGADVNAKVKYGETPLHLAANSGKTHCVKQLLKSGADIEATCTQGFTPLHAAATNGHKVIAELLCEAGAKVNAENRWGTTPLHVAATFGRLDTSESLIHNGANVKASDTKGNTPLQVAIINRHTDIAALLREAGATELA